MQRFFAFSKEIFLSVPLLTRHCRKLFATVGAIRSADAGEIEGRFLKACAEAPGRAMKILFFARDIRGGLGERRVFRVILSWLAANEPRSAAICSSLLSQLLISSAIISNRPSALLSLCRFPLRVCLRAGRGGPVQLVDDLAVAAGRDVL